MCMRKQWIPGPSFSGGSGLGTRLCRCILPHPCKTGLVETGLFVVWQTVLVLCGDTSASQMKAKQFARYVNKQYLLVGKKGKTTKRSRLSHTRGAGDMLIVKRNGLLPEKVEMLLFLNKNFYC